MESRKMTIEDIRRMDKDVLTPEEASGPLGCTGFLLGKMCHEEPEKIQFPFQCIGNRTVIPRIGFINWFENKRIWAEGGG